MSLKERLQKSRLMKKEVIQTTTSPNKHNNGSYSYENCGCGKCLVKLQKEQEQEYWKGREILKNLECFIKQNASKPT